MENLLGNVYGRLLVTDLDRVTRSYVVYWNVKCDCGTLRSVKAASLKSGRTKSCGCLKLENFIARNTKHGAAKRGNTFSLYKTWDGMLQRCHNPNTKFYRYYGAEGIRVCKPWHKYEEFREYVSKLPGFPGENNALKSKNTLDRIDGSKGYIPGNVRWATRKEQMLNMRRNRFITVNGVPMLLRTAVKLYAVVPYDVVYKRLYAGWSKKTAFITPLNSVKATRIVKA